MRQIFLIALIMFSSQINSISMAKAKMSKSIIHLPGIVQYVPQQVNEIISYLKGNMPNNKYFENRAILYGPPGNGKTAFLNALQNSNENFHFIKFSITNILSGSLHSKQLCEEFEKAEQLATNDRKVIIVIDKIHLATNTILEEAILDLIESFKNNKNIFIVFETNKIDRLSRYFKSKVSNIIEFSKPDQKMRYELIKFLLFKYQLDLTEIEINRIVSISDGMNIIDIEQFFKITYPKDNNTHRIKFEEFLDLFRNHKSKYDEKEMVRAEKERLRYSDSYTIRDPKDVQILESVIPQDIKIILNNLNAKTNLQYIPNKILLHGPPGNGKTKLAEKMAYAAGAKFCDVSSSSLLTSYQGSATEAINEIFKECEKFPQPVYIFFDEIDKLACNKNKNEDRDCGTAQLWTKISQLKTNKNITLLFATNNIELQEAFLNRFEIKYDVPIPNKEQRKELIKFFLLKHNIQINDPFIVTLADKTDCFSIRNIELLVSAVISQNNLINKRVHPIKDFLDRIELMKQSKFVKENESRFIKFCKEHKQLAFELMAVGGFVSGGIGTYIGYLVYQQNKLKK